MKITEIDALTQTTVERDATAEELAQKELDLQSVNAQVAIEAARAEAKSALLDRLGITADEAALLLS
jgi:hypothetical protein